jgi:16S rRNA G966 N2-methylase RsmD
LLERIQDEKLLATNGIIVCEHSKDVVLPDKVGHLKQVKFENYGIISISIYALKSEEE